MQKFQQDFALHHSCRRFPTL